MRLNEILPLVQYVTHNKHSVNGSMSMKVFGCLANLLETGQLSVKWGAECIIHTLYLGK